MPLHLVVAGIVTINGAITYALEMQDVPRMYHARKLVTNYIVKGTMNMKVELNGDALENIVGGQIVHTWTNDNGGCGTIWITARTPRVYNFSDYNIISWISNKQNEGWSDQEIIDYLREKSIIW